MESGSSRVAHVFIWKQGAAPDVDYARQVLSIVNPEAYRALLGSSPPVRLFSVIDDWPEEPWGRALADMRAIPAPGGALWTDPSQYELAGWLGADSRTGGRLFVVTAY